VLGPELRSQKEDFVEFSLRTKTAPPTVVPVSHRSPQAVGAFTIGNPWN